MPLLFVCITKQEPFSSNTVKIPFNCALYCMGRDWYTLYDAFNLPRLQVGTARHAIALLHCLESRDVAILHFSRQEICAVGSC